MPVSDHLPDYRTPFPDEGHEAIRRPLAQAIDDLADAALGVEDAYFLTDLLLGIADNLLTQIDAHRIRIDSVKIQAETGIDGVDDLQAKVAALTARLDALAPPV